MTQETVRALADKELMQVIAWAQEEQRARAEQRKHDTIAKIKEMARGIGVSVTFDNQTGRNRKLQRGARHVKPAKPA